MIFGRKVVLIRRSWEVLVNMCLQICDVDFSVGQMPFLLSIQRCQSTGFNSTLASSAPYSCTGIPTRTWAKFVAEENHTLETVWDVFIILWYCVALYIRDGLSHIRRHILLFSRYSVILCGIADIFWWSCRECWASNRWLHSHGVYVSDFLMLIIITYTRDVILLLVPMIPSVLSLQCFVAVVWVVGRASGL